ncbi:MAG TPA: lycopene cyclase domain-containing protein [Candidatus Babeliales bacterium]|nr:lycopene cyclase domain-containing protein [Candidatus Babeliales bacterium]
MFLFIWGIIFFFKKSLRREMLIISFFTMPFGLTEPLFVPEYWHPQSLFDLAQKTGFDIESLIFAFAIGGIASVFYNLIFNAKFKPLSEKEKKQKRHRWHWLILLSPPLIFLLLSLLTKLNPIYDGIIAFLSGSIAAIYCRSDLTKKIFVGGLLFFLLYFIFFSSLIMMFPDFVKTTWNLTILSGVLILGIPIEELLFAFSFGMLWSSLYEHYYWLSEK